MLDFLVVLYEKGLKYFILNIVRSVILVVVLFINNYYWYLFFGVKIYERNL